ncbi:probable E3 ubiquitin-protein ligase RNF144A isoform X1 [Diachasmimorpha longicaudata]|uniref:probable E3 ubiquitin-protein ligase RNF144A isoform X1 n=1 Tax=Diachasmimorpha longicaudata TaxID=58733 RepID=UPI0030B90FE1
MPSLHSLVVRRANPLMDMGTATSSVTSVNPASQKADLANKLSGIKIPLVRKETSVNNLSVNERNTGTNRGADTPLLRPESSASLEARGGSWMNIGPKTNLRKCETSVGLSTLALDHNRPINRSRVCSRCSSLLSLASSSRYSLAAGSFVPAAPSQGAVNQFLCKICLLDVSLSKIFRIDGCGCYYCKDCMKGYIEYEIEAGAYDISCPDAQCDWASVLTLTEMSALVAPELMEKHRKFRLNRDVSMDKERAWCPRAGCETICSVNSTGSGASPGPVHCPNCSTDFCSVCREPWHNGICTNLPLGIPFDNDHIKCCPMCSVPIEKDEGCAQMMCKRCKHVFCWYCLASLDDDFLLRHYDKGPCKNKLGHSRASVIWHRTQVIGIFAGFGLLLLVASPLLLLAAPCIVCCKCRTCGSSRLDHEAGNPEDTST